MSKDPKIEVPHAVRQMVEQGVEQSRAAYNQFMEVARQTTSMVAKTTDAVVPGASDIQAKAMRFAEQNANANFSLAAELARARDMQEYMDIQARFAQRQMQSYMDQAQELGKLVTELGQKAAKK